MKFVDRPDLRPADAGTRNPVQQMIAELQEQPGRWAEIARYSPERKGSAMSRGAQTKKRYPQLEYAVERDGDEFVLYFRVKPA